MTPPLPIHIRPWQASDLATVASIEASLQAHSWTLNQFADSLRQGHSGWVADCQGTTVGFALSCQVLDEASLLSLAVRRDFQRQGIARQLLAEVIASADEHGAAVLLLEVRVGNAPAQSLYRRSGFVQVGRRRGYYPAQQGREDAIVMALTLDEGGR